jgi:YfiH family protein
VPVTLELVARTRVELPLYQLDATREWGVDAFVTGRDGGASRPPYDTLNLGTHVGDRPTCVAENRRRVAAALRLESTALVTSNQVHGAHVNDVDGWSGQELVGDAMVTTRDDVALCVLVADCVPLLFVDTTGPRFGVAHAGWRGLLAGVIPATLRYFARPGDVRVVIGPHISPRTYQVGPEVAQFFSDIEGAVLPDVDGRSRLNLAAIALSQLAQCGVNVDDVALCSAATDDGAIFFSDRAQRPCGRFGLVAHRFYDSSLREGIQ